MGNDAQPTVYWFWCPYYRAICLRECGERNVYCEIEGMECHTWSPATILQERYQMVIFTNDEARRRGTSPGPPSR